ncbi:uncharacterized protein LOC141849729 isoform X1 [Brevipalpus obovatus]|uniref:uncharacterized protein LOC141849729 isoform X1 n=2 Tax=Brevipalpus obovatus TaxID=246614 RepID=UPI003D9E58A0
MVQQVKNQAELDAALKEAGEKLVIIDFYATWCGPCRNIAPTVEKMAVENADVVFLKVDVDEAEDCASTYGVDVMPTFIFLKNGSRVPSNSSSINSSLSHSSMSSIPSKKLIQGLAGSWSGKPPKNPRPERVNIIFEAIQGGLRECIMITQGDIAMLKDSIENNVSVSSAQQCKTVERYLKRLEFELAKLEELKDQYDIHLRMRDGVKSMAYAYTLSTGQGRNAALSSVRSGFKECTEMLCSLESRLEGMMGSMYLQMKGIQGFARLCPGDVFEITIKHGDQQKWKTRGKILKDGTQCWESQQTLIKALIGERLTIKAVEVRGLGRSIVLGNKICETKDLFCARPQLMTINLNSVGTLKLNLITTWNPLHYSSDNDPGASIGRNFHSSSSLSRLTSSKTLPDLLSSPFASTKSKILSSSTLLSPPRVTEIIDANFYIHRSPSSISSFKSIQNDDTRGTHIPASASTDSRGSSSVANSIATSGFGSATSDCGSSLPNSLPNSTLTSPETEIPPELPHTQIKLPPPEPPIKQPLKSSSSINSQCLQETTEKLLKELGKSSQEMIVQATVHQSSNIESPCGYGSSTNSNSNNYSYCSSRGSGREMHSSPISVDFMSYLCFNVSDILLTLISSLEDIRGQFSELHSLEQSVLDLYSILKTSSRSRRAALLRSSNNRSSNKDMKYLYQNEENSRLHSPDERNGKNHETNSGSLRQNYHRRCASSASDVSIESALKCFDFLNTTTDSDQDSSPEHNRIPPPPMANNKDHGGCNLKNVSRNQMNNHSSCNSPLSQRFFVAEKCSSRATISSMSSLASSFDGPLVLSSGSEQLDLALIFHLYYCQRLLQNLGSLGLQRKEQRSLEKLQCQGMVIHRLGKLCFNLCEYFEACTNLDKASDNCSNEIKKKRERLEAEYNQRQARELFYFRQDSRTNKLWDTVCYQNVTTTSEEIGSMLICVTSEQFAQTLESYMRAFLTPLPSNGINGHSRRISIDMYRKVAQLITARLIDIPLYEPGSLVTIFQVAIFFTQENSGLEYLFRSYAEEISLIDCLQKDHPINLQHANNNRSDKKRNSRQPPPPPPSSSHTYTMFSPIQSP